MTEEDTKLAASTLMGLVGFLLSHIFVRVMKKNEDQEKLSTDTRLLEDRVDRLEEDARDIKKDLASHLRDHGRHRYDDER